MAINPGTETIQIADNSIETRPKTNNAPKEVPSRSSKVSGFEKIKNDDNPINTTDHTTIIHK